MFRFTIRDVLWLMVVVGLIVGWWVDHRYVAAAAREDIWPQAGHGVLNETAGVGLELLISAVNIAPLLVVAYLASRIAVAVARKP